MQALFEAVRVRAGVQGDTQEEAFPEGVAKLAQVAHVLAGGWPAAFTSKASTPLLRCRSSGKPARCSHVGRLSAQVAYLDSPAMTRKRDIKQFRQASKEAGLTASERFEASDTLHAEKESGGGQDDMTYAELLAWLREWKDTWQAS